MQITLANEDSYILSKFLEYLKSNSKFYIEKEKYTKLIIDNIKLFSDLIKLGCIPNKSFILKFPTKDQVPDKFLNHFIRGYFDGDGHISKRGKCFNINITGSNDFIEGILHLFNILNIEHTGKKKRYINKKDSAYQLYIRSKSSKIFINYLYNNSTIFLLRKYKVTL